MTDTLAPYRLRDGLGYRLSRATRVVQDRLERQLAAQGLTRLGWCIMSGVGFEGKTSPSELADHIGVTRSVVSRTLKPLVQAGLVARQLSDQDGRARDLKITQAGQHVLANCRPIVEQHQAHFLSKLTEHQKTELSGILDALVAGEPNKLDGL